MRKTSPRVPSYFQIADAAEDVVQDAFVLGSMKGDELGFLLQQHHTALARLRPWVSLYPSCFREPRILTGNARELNFARRRLTTRSSERRITGSRPVHKRAGRDCRG